MEMKTIRQVAEEQGISYEAVRRQVAKYRRDLKGHVTTKGRQRFLDEYAVDFIAHRRRESPVVVLQQDTNAELLQIREELERSRAELENMKNMLLAAQDRIINLQDEQAKMIAAQTQYDLLLAEHTEEKEELERTKQILTETEQELENAKDALSAAEAEAASYQKSVFGFYRKIK